MTIQGPAIPAAAPVPRILHLAPTVFAATLFVSALLLFAVQPMFTKMVLPRLGGSPSVWSVAMVFFQATLLAGYGYAHLVATRLSIAAGALVHLAVLAAAAATLPIGVAAGFDVPPQQGVALWLVGLFGASIGLPFAALSASAPLLQSWFARSGHVQAGNPYVLYAASNLGSFAALMAYPFVIEPFLSLREQALWWSVGFAALSVCVALSGVIVARAPHATATNGQTDAAPVTARQRLVWIALAAIPAGLVIAVTAYIATDVASAPFLWVIPLALYLLTFVALFRDRPWVRHDHIIAVAPFVLAPLSIGILGGDKAYWLTSMILNLAGFLVLALMCHGELYRRRPAPARLTEFYLWTSLGGVIGGAFAGLAAPHLFNNIYEYPILIVCAALALPGVFATGWRDALGQAVPFLALAVAVSVPPLAFGISLPGAMQIVVQVVLVALVGVMLVWREHRVRLVGLMVLCFVVSDLWLMGERRVETARSFFGVHQVVETHDGRHRILRHGTTIHGAERIREADGRPVTGKPQPLAYYYVGGPISEAIAHVRARRGGALAQVAAVGLGAGTVACLSTPGETWRFFEIDPEVVRLAREVFRFLSSCAPQAPITLGDARLTLAASPQHFDLILLDAFSSDAIPSHLLTREAVAGYGARLAQGGAIVAHISNRHMELTQLMAAVGATEGFITYVKEDRSVDRLARDFRANALVVVLARSEADLGDLPQRPGWQRVAPDPSVRPWTDDYSDLLSVMLRKRGLQNRSLVVQ